MGQHTFLSTAYASADDRALSGRPTPYVVPRPEVEGADGTPVIGTPSDGDAIRPHQ
jgi:hypothetical protein